MKGKKRGLPQGTRRLASASLASCRKKRKGDRKKNYGGEERIDHSSPPLGGGGKKRGRRGGREPGLCGQHYLVY